MQSVFERYEKKYLLSPQQHQALNSMLQEHFLYDDYGRHTIQNVYWDTPDFALIRASIEKPPYKEKFRVRSYGTPKADGPVFVELKKKYDGIVYKRRISMSLAQSNAYLLGGEPPARSGQILREIDFFRKSLPLQPQIVLCYERTALYGRQDGNLRLTLDEDIRWRGSCLDLGQGSWGQNLLPKDRILMEVKIPGAMPLWMSRTFSQLEIFPISFSKYGSCYTQHLSNFWKQKGGALSA